MGPYSGIIVWSFSPAAVAANAARDLGGRLAVLTLWGTPAAGGSYAAIAALTNIPATIAGGIVYYFIFSDSDRGECAQRSVASTPNQSFLPSYHACRPGVDRGFIGL